jgi:carbonic anhydrase
MNRKALVFLSILLSAVIMISCGGDKPVKDTKEKDHVKTEKVSEKHDHAKPHWSHHEGEDGPENWANLCDGFKECAGQAQSPIDIKDAVANESLKPIEFTYGESKAFIINNGHTVQFNVDPGSYITISDKKYDLLQFHYHATSEHTINGEYYPLEVHFVHKHSDSDLAVVGIMYEQGDVNKLFEKFLQHFPTEKGEWKSEEVFNLAEILPENRSYYHYSGSLTTPPCTEVVSWFLLKNALPASEEQIKKFSEILDKNFRPVQATNEREIYVYAE